MVYTLGKILAKTTIPNRVLYLILNVFGLNGQAKSTYEESIS